MNNLDNYNFSYLPAPSSPGFILFQNEENKLHYFHCNDIKGLPFLYSQSYQTSTSAEKGLRAVLKNAVKPNRYKEIDSPEGFLFILKAGNHQEIARSSVYPTKTEQRVAMQYLNRVAESKYPMAKIEEEKSRAKVSTASLINDTASKTQNKAHQLPRHIFRLEFYKGEGLEEQFAGIIHCLGNSEKQVFKGVDWKTIKLFIVDNLPNYHHKVLTELKSTATLKEDIIPKAATFHQRIDTKLSSDNSQKGIERIPVPNKSAKLTSQKKPLTLQLNNQYGHHFLMNRMESNYLHLGIQKDTLSRIQQKDFIANVSLHRLGEAKISSDQYVQNLSFKEPEVVIPLNTKGLASGTYRIAALVRTKDNILENSCYMHLI